MPDRRKHRGKHPEDDELFAERHLAALRSAVTDFAWLLSRGYADNSALKLVGDRFNLTARQRLAVWRCSCADPALVHRRSARRMLEEIHGALGVDGYNLLITIESALSGGLILHGRDGCYRDLASVHGTYRKVAETIPALELIMEYLAHRVPAGVDCYLDSPVSNSGRLKTLMAELLERRAGATPDHTTWNNELVGNPDTVLMSYAGPIVTSDSVVLDGCTQWVNLAADIIDHRVPDAWIVDLSGN